MFDYDDYDPMADLTFVEERKPMPEKSMKPTKVRVTGPWQVQHDGNLYYEDQEATVPEHVAEAWERARWVERVSPKRAKPPQQEHPAKTPDAAAKG